MSKPQLLSLREMLAYACLYHGAILLLLALLSSAMPWLLFLTVAGACALSWMAGGQIVAWAYDERRKSGPRP